MPKTAVRFRPVRTVSALAAATRHALREDATGRARVRPGAQPGAALSWTAHGVKGRDQVAAFKAHKEVTGAQERKGAPIALAAICVVSPEWIDEAGDRHDPKNPRNRELLLQAGRWAESWAGKGSVIAARLDLDEAGGGVVDLTIVPVRVQRSRGGKETRRISTNGALADLVAQTGAEAKSYAAAQTSWARWAQRTLDPAMERGIPREKTGAENLTPEQYGRVKDEMRALKARRDALEAENVALHAKGREWAAGYKADVEAETKAEAERQLAPLRTWKGRFAALRKGDEDERAAAIDAAVKEAKKAEKVVQDELRSELDRIRVDRRKDAETIKNLRENSKETARQRDAAYAQIRQLTPADPKPTLGRRGPL